MAVNLSEEHSLVSNWVSELRDINVQQDRMRFRTNLKKIAYVAAYEISKELPWKEKEITTPLGTAKNKVLDNQPVLATILRAGLAMHEGLLEFYDKADNAFISAFRRHKKNEDGSYEINLGYISCPSLDERIVIISDPMLATGSSLVKSIKHLKKEGIPSRIYIVCAIAALPGIEHVLAEEPSASIWCGDIDPVLNEKGYIIPGLGDAGDLAYGAKVQI